MGVKVGRYNVITGILHHCNEKKTFCLGKRERVARMGSTGSEKTTGANLLQETKFTLMWAEPVRLGETKAQSGVF